MRREREGGNRYLCERAEAEPETMPEPSREPQRLPRRHR